MASTLHEYYITLGKNASQIIFPGAPAKWPKEYENREAIGYTEDEPEYYGGLLVAESIRAQALSERLVAAWNGANGVETENLHKCRLDDTAQLLRFVRKVLVNGGGLRLRQIAADKIDEMLAVLPPEHPW